MIKQIDRDACRLIRAEFEPLLVEAGKRLGVAVQFGRATFNSGSVTFKVEAAVVATNGNVMTREASAFKQMANFYGLEPEDLGRTFHSRNRAYKIIGLSTRASQYPILATEEGGKTYKFAAADVKLYLSREKTSHNISTHLHEGNALPA